VTSTSFVGADKNAHLSALNNREPCAHFLMFGRRKREIYIVEDYFEWMNTLVEGRISPISEMQEAFIDYIEKSSENESYSNVFFPNDYSIAYQEYRSRLNWLADHSKMTVSDAKKAWEKRDQYKHYQQRIIRSIIRHSMGLPDFDYTYFIRADNRT